MYGTRDAALNWAMESGSALKEAGYKQGIANPCLFRHEEKDVTIMVHGDDFVAVGKEEDLQDTEKTLNQRYKLKVETLGNEEKDLKEMRVLNKVIRITSAGLELEADPRHAELVVKALGLEGASISKTPGVKHSSVRGQGGETEVRKQESGACGKRRVERQDGEVSRRKRPKGGRRRSTTVE